MRYPVFRTFLPALLITVAHTAPVTRGAPPTTEPVASAREGIELVTALHDPAKTRYRIGEIIWFDLKVRNPTNHVVEGVFSTEQAFYTPPAIDDAHGKPVQVLRPNVIFAGIWALIPYRLAPGEARDVGKASLVFDPHVAEHDTPGHPRPQCVARAGPGKYRVTYPASHAIEVEIR